MNKLQMKSAEREKLVKDVTDLFAKGDDNLTQEDLTAIKSKNTAINALDVEIKDLKEIEDIAQKNAQRLLDSSSVNPADRPGGPAGGGSNAANVTMSWDVPAYCKGGNPRNLIKVCGNREEAQRVALGFGHFAAGVLTGNQKSLDWCKSHGIVVAKAQAENNNATGGFLVPIEFANYVITLIEEFGVARRLLHTSKMASDTKDIPRRAGVINTYFLNDNAAITATQKRWDMIQLVAKKLAAFIFFSNEIAEDAMIDIGDDLMKEIAWAFAAVEDECCFLGDGTSKYGGILGFGPAITKAFATGTGSPGLITGHTGSGSAWSSYVLTDFEALLAALPGFAWKTGRPAWMCTQQFFYGAMVPLAAAAGGNRISDILAGAKENVFLGCPVEFTQVLTTSPGVSQIDCFLGDLNLAGEFGDRRQLTIATSSDFGFSADQIAIRGIERFDINAANVGGHTPSAQAINQNYLQDGTTNYAGPIVALKSFSS